MTCRCRGSTRNCFAKSAGAVPMCVRFGKVAGADVSLCATNLLANLPLPFPWLLFLSHSIMRVAAGASGFLTLIRSGCRPRLVFTAIRAPARRMPMARPVAFLDETLAAQIALARLRPGEVRRCVQMAALAHRQRAIHEATARGTTFFHLPLGWCLPAA